MTIGIKRIYDSYEKKDGYRILVDRLWPRGLKKETAHLDEWNKSLSPSTSLRKKFHESRISFKEFSEEYREELQAAGGKELNRIREISIKRPVTLLYASRDTEHNHAFILKQVLGSKA